MSLYSVTRGFLLFGALWAYVRLFRETLVDDAFITLRYSAMLAGRGEWGFLPDRISNTATSPLSVIVHAIASFVTPTMVDAVVLLAALEFLALLFLLLRISRRLFEHTWFGWLAFVTLATNCLLVSTFGLEGTLVVLLIVWSIDRYVAEDWTWLAVACGLAVLARPDAGLLVFIYAVDLVRRRAFRWKTAVVFALTMAPWFLYSWIHIGSLVPDTLQIKIGQSGWGRNLTLFNGVGYYFGRYPLETVGTFALVPFVLAAWWSARPNVKAVATIVGAYALLHSGAYSAMKVPPYHWYYVNEVVCIAIAGALGATNLVHAALFRARGARRALFYLTTAVPAIPLVVSMGNLGLPLREAPIHTNWGTLATYRQVGEWIRANVPADAAIFEYSEIGTVGFYADRLIVNEFSDSNRTFGAIVERYPTLPRLAQLVIDANFYWRELQPALPDPKFALAHYSLPNDEVEKVKDRIVMSWDTSTRWVPRGRLYLLRRTTREAP